MQKKTNNYLDPACRISSRTEVVVACMAAWVSRLCPSFVLDDFGHHTLSCKHGGGELSRHNKLRDIFSDFCQRACLGPRLEMRCGHVGLGLPCNSQSRPVDVPACP